MYYKLLKTQLITVIIFHDQCNHRSHHYHKNRLVTFFIARFVAPQRKTNLNKFQKGIYEKTRTLFFQANLNSHLQEKGLKPKSEKKPAPESFSLAV